MIYQVVQDEAGKRLTRYTLSIVPQIVSTVLEEHGIQANAYQFQHSTQDHVLVFGDDQSAFGKLGQPTAYLQDNGMTSDEPVIKRFAVRLETRTSRTTRHDYDFEQPRLLMEAAFKADRDPEAKPLPDLEDYDYPGRFVDRTRGKHLSQRNLERHRADYRLAEGRGDQPKLLSGHFLEVSDHPRGDYNDL